MRVGLFASPRLSGEGQGEGRLLASPRPCVVIPDLIVKDRSAARAKRADGVAERVDGRRVWADSPPLKMVMRGDGHFKGRNRPPGRGLETPAARSPACFLFRGIDRVPNATWGLTEADVTRPMVMDCLRELLLLEPQVNKELERLTRVRKHQLRSSRIPAAVLPFSRLNERVTWSARLSVPLIGAAAARSSPWVVEMCDDDQMLALAPGAAVLVANDTLEPVARCGQWALLASEDVVANDGDLAAVMDSNGNRYLRRVWSDGENWILDVVNPVHPLPPVSIKKMDAPLRKVVGVLYEPMSKVSDGPGKITEWEPSGAVDISATIRKYHAIDVMGASLEPLARPGQKMLVGEKCENISDIRNATLAVVQTESVGNVIKRVYPTDRDLILASPNPVETIDLILLPQEDMLGIWPVCGVLFETSDECP